jgi:hypothetical protein
MRLIEQADPPSQTTVEISGPVDVNSMSWSELIAYADAHGIDWRTVPGTTDSSRACSSRSSAARTVPSRTARLTLEAAATGCHPSGQTAWLSQPER